MVTNIKQVPILLHTMDSYSWTWNHWYTLFKKYVSNHGPIYFLSEETAPDFVDDVIHIKSGNGEWGKRLLKGLEQIDSDLIFYMQEDFWATNDLVLSDDILDLFYQLNMETLHIKDVLFDYGKFTHIQNELYRLQQYSQFTLNHQFGLWDVETMKSLVLPNETPWMNEINGTNRRNTKEHNVYILNHKWYISSVAKGKLLPRGKQVLIDNNLIENV